MKKIIFMLVIIFSTSLFADQAAWITKEQATNAVKLLVTTRTIRHFCEPCGDKFFREEKIVMVDSGPAEPKKSIQRIF